MQLNENGVLVTLDADDWSIYPRLFMVDICRTRVLSLKFRQEPVRTFDQIQYHAIHMLQAAQAIYCDPEGSEDSRQEAVHTLFEFGDLLIHTHTFKNYFFHCRKQISRGEECGAVEGPQLFPEALIQWQQGCQTEAMQLYFKLSGLTFEDAVHVARCKLDIDEFFERLTRNLSAQDMGPSDKEVPVAGPSNLRGHEQDGSTSTPAAGDSDPINHTPALSPESSGSDYFSTQDGAHNHDQPATEGDAAKDNTSAPKGNADAEADGLSDDSARLDDGEVEELSAQEKRKKALQALAAKMRGKEKRDQNWREERRKEKRKEGSEEDPKGKGGNDKVKKEGIKQKGDAAEGSKKKVMQKGGSKKASEGINKKAGKGGNFARRTGQPVGKLLTDQQGSAGGSEETEETDETAGGRKKDAKKGESGERGSKEVAKKDDDGKDSGGTKDRLRAHGAKRDNQGGDGDNDADGPDTDNGAPKKPQHYGGTQQDVEDRHLLPCGNCRTHQCKCSFALPKSHRERCRQCHKNKRSDPPCHHKQWLNPKATRDWANWTRTKSKLEADCIVYGKLEVFGHPDHDKIPKADYMTVSAAIRRKYCSERFWDPLETPHKEPPLQQDDHDAGITIPPGTPSKPPRAGTKQLSGLSPAASTPDRKRRKISYDGSQTVLRHTPEVIIHNANPTELELDRLDSYEEVLNQFVMDYAHHAAGSTVGPEGREASMATLCDSLCNSLWRIRGYPGTFTGVFGALSGKRRILM